MAKSPQASCLRRFFFWDNRPLLARNHRFFSLVFECEPTNRDSVYKLTLNIRYKKGPGVKQRQAQKSFE